MTMETIELASFFDQTALDPETYERYADAAYVSLSVRRVLVRLPTAFPLAPIFFAVARALGAT